MFVRLKGDEAKTHFEFLSGQEKKLRETNYLSDQINTNNKARFRMGVLQIEVGSRETGLYW